MEPDTSITMEQMEKQQTFMQCPTYHLTEADKKLDLLEVIRRLPPEYLSEPFIRIPNSNMENLYVNTNVMVEVAEKEFGGMKHGTPETTVEDTGVKKRMLLSDYLEECKQKGTATIYEFLSRKSKENYSFFYLSNVPVPEGMLNLRDVGNKWDLNSMGINEDFEGISTPYLYVSRVDSVSPFHLEDANVRSINWLLQTLTPGGVKVWFGFHNRDITRVQEILSTFSASDKCPVFWRHKHHWMDLAIFASHNIPVYKTVQYPGDIIITNSFHQVAIKCLKLFGNNCI